MLIRNLHDLPVFTKTALKLFYFGKENALNQWVKRALAKGKIIQLKKGLYTTKGYLDKEPNKDSFYEYIASVMRGPSYLSLDYVLAKYNLLTEAVYTFTSVTIKSNRDYLNSLGTFRYRSIKKLLFAGYEKRKYRSNDYYVATKAKALFDYFYYKRNILSNLKYEISEGLRINWVEFNNKDIEEFKSYVELSESFKMKRIYRMIQREVFGVKRFT